MGRYKYIIKTKKQKKNTKIQEIQQCNCQAKYSKFQYK